MAIIEFTVHIDNASTIVALFDRLEVWRSDTELGSYTNLTADENTAALLDGSVAGPWTLSGKTLTAIVDSAAPKSVVFSGTNPLTAAQVLAQINAVFPGLASEVPTDTDRIRLTSPTLGTASVLELTGDAVATLGLSGTRIAGKTARLVMAASVDDYLFRDYDGTDGYWYKTRYYSTVTGAISSFSPALQGGDGSAVPTSFTVTGQVAMANMSGDPIIGRRVIFVATGPQILSDGAGHNYGILPSVDRVVVVTDINGRATVKLIKGQRLKVFLEGTSFQREFVVPDADFDVLTVASTEPDPLSIVVAPPLPTRVS